MSEPTRETKRQIERMGRTGKLEEHSNNDRWLISYADFITLLFAFFVVMYSVSSVNETKYTIFSDSLRLAFAQQASSTQSELDRPHVEVGQKSQLTVLALASRKKVVVDKDIAELGEQQRKVESRMKKLEKGLNDVMAEMVQQGLVSINLTKRGIVMDISAGSLFGPGDAALQPVALNVLHSVARILSKEDLPIDVEGHTDDVPIKTDKFPSNWELSAVRASSVVRLLIENGVPEKRLSAVGLAANQPKVPNDTPANRIKNRRVTITVVSPNLERE